MPPGLCERRFQSEDGPVKPPRIPSTPNASAPAEPTTYTDDEGRTVTRVPPAYAEGAESGPTARPRRGRRSERD